MQLSATIYDESRSGQRKKTLLETIQKGRIVQLGVYVCIEPLELKTKCQKDFTVRRARATQHTKENSGRNPKENRLRVQMQNDTHTHTHRIGCFHVDILLIYRIRFGALSLVCRELYRLDCHVYTNTRV